MGKPRGVAFKNRTYTNDNKFTIKLDLRRYIFDSAEAYYKSKLVYLHLSVTDQAESTLLELLFS